MVVCPSYFLLPFVSAGQAAAEAHLSPIHTNQALQKKKNTGSGPTFASLCLNTFLTSYCTINTGDIHAQITHLNKLPPQCGHRIHLWQYTPTTQTSHIMDVDPVHTNSLSEDTFIRTDQVGNLFCKTNSNLTAKPLSQQGVSSSTCFLL